MGTTSAPPDGWIVTAGTWNSGVSISTAQTLHGPSSIVMSAAGITIVGPWMPVDPFDVFGGSGVSGYTYRKGYQPAIWLYADNTGNKYTANFAYYGADKTTTTTTPVTITQSTMGIGAWQKFSSYVNFGTGALASRWARWEISTTTGHTGNLYISNTFANQSAPYFALYNSAATSVASTTSAATATPLVWQGMFGCLTSLAGGSGGSQLIINDTGVWQMNVALKLSASATVIPFFYNVTGSTVLGNYTSGVQITGTNVNFSSAFIFQKASLQSPYSAIQLRLQSSAAITAIGEWSGFYLQ